MVKYVRKSQRQSWSEASMAEAIAAVQSKRMGWQLAAKTFHVPATTLRRRTAHNKGATRGYLGGQLPTFNSVLEAQIVDRIRELEIRFFGLTTTDVRKLAFELAEKNGIKHNFSREKKMAGWAWLHGFNSRNPSISLRSPEATSAARAQAFNKPQIKKYFDALGKVLEDNNFTSDQIWNMDESGLSTVQRRTQKIYATKGRKQVGALTSAERGQHLTIVCCMNASGVFVPPALIYPRKNMKNELMDNAPPSAIAFPQESGWMTGEVCLRWMKHFVKYVKSSQENKVLLLVDGHSSHKNLEVLDYAKSNGVIVFCFPPHCTHRVQPLDVSFYGPLNTYYDQEVRKWLHQNPGRTVTHFQVAGLFKEAYFKAATISNAVNGFKKTGIHPFNADVFQEWMFAPSDVTDLPPDQADPEIDAEVDSPIEAELDPPIEADNASLTEAELESSIEGNIDPSTETVHDVNVKVTQSGAYSLNVTVKELTPLPKISAKVKRRTGKKGIVGVINSSPALQEAKDKEALKQATIIRKAASAVKRNFSISDDHSSPCQSKKNQAARKSSVSARKKMQLDEDDDSFEADPYQSSEEDDDASCLYCNELYSLSKSGDVWIKCQICSKWCHTDCAGVSRKQKVFICELCQ